MNEQELLDLLLTNGGERWFLYINDSGKVEIDTRATGEVLSETQCPPPKQSSSDDSTITAPTQADARASRLRERLALVSR